jgi:hypothetical protein
MDPSAGTSESQGGAPAAQQERSKNDKRAKEGQKYRRPPESESASQMPANPPGLAPADMGGEQRRRKPERVPGAQAAPPNPAAAGGPSQAAPQQPRGKGKGEKPGKDKKGEEAPPQ